MINVWMLDFRNIMSLGLREVRKYVLYYVVGGRQLKHMKVVPLMIQFPA